MQTLTFLLPVYNDWKSLQKLLIGIDSQLIKLNKNGNILIIDDNSTVKQQFNIKKFKKIQRIEILKLKINLGSQKAIAIGLNFLKLKKTKTIVTILDSDGEDDYTKIPTMVKMVYKLHNKIIVSCRTKRNEGILFNFLYSIHKIILFIFSGMWINFGNFSSFNSKNIRSIMSNDSSWFALSSCIARNCKVYKTFAERKKRFFGKSKLSLPDLFFHSVRVNLVFRRKIMFLSLIYILLAFFLIKNFLISTIIIFTIIIFNLTLIVAYIKVKPKDFLIKENFIKKINYTLK